jgi:hypothetical protein
MSDEPKASCPECGQESERLLSGGAGFLFKGEGFYVTDYRSEDYKKAASKESQTEITSSDPAKSPGKKGQNPDKKGADGPAAAKSPPTGKG